MLTQAIHQISTRLHNYFYHLVHHSAGPSPLNIERHKSFIMSQFLGGVMGLCALPIYVVVTGQINVLIILAFLWFITPLGIAFFLSWSGRLFTAHFISACNLAGLITFAMLITGGIESFLVVWMIIVPLEAALSGNRKVVNWAITLAGTSLVGVYFATHLGHLPAQHVLPFEPIKLSLLGALSAALYAAGLAASVQVMNERSEQAVRESEKRYRLLAENTSDLISEHTENGDVEFASAASHHIFRQEPEALSGDGFLKLIRKSDQLAYLSALSKVKRDGEPISVEFRLEGEPEDKPTDADGTEIVKWFEMRCRPLTLSGESEEAACAQKKGLKKIIAVTRDVSQRKAQELAYLKARDAAERANLTKTQFLANISHELRTPLSAIIGFSELIEKNGPMEIEKSREYVRIIHKSGDHLLTVVNDLLDMSKIEAGKFEIEREPFQLDELIKSCIEIVQSGAEEKSIEVSDQVEASLPVLLADKKACRQMLLNLLSNSIKFTDEKGWIKVHAVRHEKMIKISVSDNGIGIPEEDIPNLGNPFTQTENSYSRHYEGTGLGLSVVKGLIQLHGGQMNIESKVGEGTTVSLRFPIDQAYTAEGRSDEKTELSLARGFSSGEMKMSGTA